MAVDLQIEDIATSSQAFFLSDDVDHLEWSADLIAKLNSWQQHVMGFSGTFGARSLYATSLLRFSDARYGLRSLRARNPNHM